MINFLPYWVNGKNLNFEPIPMLNVASRCVPIGASLILQSLYYKYTLWSFALSHSSSSSLFLKHTLWPCPQTVSCLLIWRGLLVDLPLCLSILLCLCFVDGLSRNFSLTFTWWAICTSVESCPLKSLLVVRRLRGNGKSESWCPWGKFSRWSRAFNFRVLLCIFFNWFCLMIVECISYFRFSRSCVILSRAFMMVECCFVCYLVSVPVKILGFCFLKV